MRFKRTIFLLILLVSVGATSLVKSAGTGNSSQEKTSPKIIRQTKEQAKDAVLKALANKELALQSPPKRDAQDTSVFGKPITALLPLDKIESIFVPHSFLAVNGTSAESLSDADILKLLTHSQLTSEKAIFKFHLAPWKTLHLRMSNKEYAKLDLMLDRCLGFVLLPDGQVYGFTMDERCRSVTKH